MRRRIMVAMVALACAACGGGDDAPDANASADSPPASMPAPVPPPPTSAVTMSPRTGPPGTEVTLAMTGLLMNQPTEVGFGTFAGHEIIDTMQASAEGAVSVTVAVPGTTAPGAYFFFIAERNGSPIAVSDSFVVTP